MTPVQNLPDVGTRLPLLLKPSDLEKLLSVSRPVINKLWKLGHLKAITTPGGQRRYLRDSLLAYLAQHAR